MIYRKQLKNIDIIAPDCLVISEEFSGNAANLLI